MDTRIELRRIKLILKNSGFSNLIVFMCINNEIKPN